ncbi:DNA replication terminus site-binding protein [Pseudomonas aeruginosa]|uniref:DNA replication terminus site-binding protein n=1 Tax=Pseudomonas aeruginosa TaxID=287 RepID=UPI000EB5E8B4|nr:DNA replication terminus site-binding protein [Pseudomonas aeruginosa]
MTIYISPQQGIKELVYKLESRLDTLANRMRARPDRLRVDVAYLLPFRDQAEVDEKKGIEVCTLSSEEAARHAIYGLTSIRIEQGKQNPRETLRVPGVIALPPDWLAELRELNGIKHEIELLVGQIEDQYERMKLWGSMKYLSSLQTMRQAWIISGPAKVRFYWDSAPSIQNKTASEWVANYTAHLKKLYGYVPALDELGEADGSRKFVVAISMLSGINTNVAPNEKIAAFRQGQPHVRARVTYIDKIKAQIRPAPTPIVYPIDDPVPKITPLSNWEPTERGPSRSDRAKIESEPFVEALYLHRYLEPYRFDK